MPTKVSFKKANKIKNVKKKSERKGNSVKPFCNYKMAKTFGFSKTKVLGAYIT
jgi:hypothetical protein